MIPFSPPRVDDLTIQAVTEVLKSGWITTGPQTKKFEVELAKYLDVSKVICLNSWTNAAELFLKWWGIQPGDEVLLPAYTYAASCNIIVHLGATPVMVDSEPGKFQIDLHDLEKKITSKTKVIMPVDIGGFPCKYEEILELIHQKKELFEANSTAQKKLGRILLFSDAAHSLGSKYKGDHTVKATDVSCYSFHAVKNLTTAEGGALAFHLPESFNPDDIYKELNILSLHGQTKDALSKTNSGNWRYDIVAAGYKCNMTDMQAAIGNVELNRYESETLPKRKSICNAYHNAFKDLDWYLAPEMIVDNTESSYHLFQLRIKGYSEKDRDDLISELKSNGISTNVHFQPLPFFTFYKNLGYEINDFPNAKASYENEISLPVFYDLTDVQLETIIQTIIQCITNKSIG